MNKAKCQMTKREIYSPNNYFVDIEEEKNKAVERVRMAYDFSQKLGLGKLYAEPFDNDENYYTVTCVEEKVHKMTLADIEKELGYKIELKEN